MLDNFCLRKNLNSEGCFIFAHGILRMLVLMAVYTYEH